MSEIILPTILCTSGVVLMIISVDLCNRCVRYTLILYVGPQTHMWRNSTLLQSMGLSCFKLKSKRLQVGRIVDPVIFLGWIGW